MTEEMTDGNASPRKPLASTDARSQKAKKKILIVDDQEDVTTSLKLGLQRRGMEVTAFNDPLEALAELKRIHDYHLVITDINMPQMNGFELYRQIKKYDGGTLVYFLTGSDMFEKEFETMFPDAHPEALLKKPISIADLAARIDGLTDGREPSAQTVERRGSSTSRATRS